MDNREVIGFYKDHRIQKIRPITARKGKRTHRNLITKSKTSTSHEVRTQKSETKNTNPTTPNKGTSFSDMEVKVVELSVDDVELEAVYSYDSHEYGTFIMVRVVPKKNVIQGVPLRTAWNEWLRKHNSQDLPELLEDGGQEVWRRYNELKRRFVESHIKVVYRLSEEAINKLWWMKVDGKSPKLQYLKDWKIETIIQKN
ncbi:MAG: hypothetical protein B6U95_07515 [Thermofilum sp. ex4484_82]|nr:MAG: hypothetical protein B6U95_07515 [Thermofilum sp. ex4484_82]OYT37070.1 MAG: hypothetical protein B6U96_07510 [Archaeoglobales archaeon ex4484_92]